MNIHEFQAKQMLGRFGAARAQGATGLHADEAAAAFTALGQPKAVIKVQIHAGGRGKAGGVQADLVGGRGARVRRASCSASR